MGPDYVCHTGTNCPNLHVLLALPYEMHFFPPFKPPGAIQDWGFSCSACWVLTFHSSGVDGGGRDRRGDGGARDEDTCASAHPTRSAKRSPPFLTNKNLFPFTLSPCSRCQCQLGRLVHRMNGTPSTASLCPSIHPSVRPSVCPSVCLSVCLSVCPFFCLLCHPPTHLCRHLDPGDKNVVGRDVDVCERRVLLVQAAHARVPRRLARHERSHLQRQWARCQMCVDTSDTQRAHCQDVLRRARYTAGTLSDACDTHAHSLGGQH
jgi:hypothetical protein